MITIGLRPRTPGLSYEPPACVPVHVPLTGPSRQANELGADVACLLLSRGMALALALALALLSTVCVDIPKTRASLAVKATAASA